MPKVYEVMTPAPATCGPDTTVSQVADIMRERDIGSVLVVEDGKLKGLVTDRDLATRALTGKDDPQQTPVSKFMSTKVVTGDAQWRLDQAAEAMAKHQIRRLPILQDGRLAGILSLGDLALHDERERVVADTLQAVSTPYKVQHLPGSFRGRGALVTIALAALGVLAIAAFARTRTGRELQKRVTNTVNSGMRSAKQAVNAAGNQVQELQEATGKSVRQFSKQMRSNFTDLSENLSERLPELPFVQTKQQHRSSARRAYKKLTQRAA